MSTQLIGFDPTEYEILALNGPDLQIKGTVITSASYIMSGKSYNARYERTQFFTKQ